MRRWHLLFLSTLLWIGAGHTAAAQGGMDAPLPLDPTIRIATLENGLRYYIRENAEPKNRAELWLVVRAGSILEDDDQLGLAHFLEHMAFNGTEHFESNELINYMERIGMRFGADLNAYTSLDETVYTLTVPTDNDEFVATGFQILEDWAHGQLLDPDEIEKERGVVIEEWRLKRGAEQRIRDMHHPVLYHGSRYAERLPIGKKETLERAGRDELLRFYNDWYRPDLMAVIAVGDFDARVIETRIRDHFSRLGAREDSRERITYPVPPHVDTLYSIASDEEASQTQVQVYAKFPAWRVKTRGDYRRVLLIALYIHMLGQRYGEIVQKADPPFIAAWASHPELTPTTDAFVLTALVRDNQIVSGMKALLIESERAARHGFTSSELERARKDLLRSVESAYNERNKTESDRYAQACLNHFLSEYPLPGIEYRYETYNDLLPGIGVDEVSDVFIDQLENASRVVMLSAPEKDDLSVPGESDLRSAYDDVRAMDIAPYEDDVSGESLISEPPEPGTVVRETHLEDQDITLWELSNGVRVYLKPTDFKNNEILCRMWSPGGTSLAADRDFWSAQLAAVMISNSGIGQFTMIDLQKLLAGKQVGFQPVVGELSEGFTGSCAPKDLELFLQIAYLSCTEPRHDEVAFSALQQRYVAFLENRAADPDQAFADSMTVILSQNHPRVQPLTSARVAAVDLDKAFAFYSDRFGDASDFTVAFVGALDIDDVRPLIERYLGGLPSSGRKEAWRDVGIEAPQGIIDVSFERGIDDKAKTAFVFHGDFEWSREARYALRSLGDALDIRLREVLREDLGGTYGVSVGGSPIQYPSPRYQFSIQFGCDPARLKELSAEVLTLVENVKANGVSQDIVDKVAETQRRVHEQQLRENRHWLGAIWYCDQNGIDLSIIGHHEEMIATLDSELVRNAARRYLDLENYVHLTMSPETVEEPTPVGVE